MTLNCTYQVRNTGNAVIRAVIASSRIVFIGGGEAKPFPELRG